MSWWEDMKVIAAAGEEMAPMLFTSGQMLDAARAKALAGAGLVAALVSLDHHSADVHDRMRGVPGAFRTTTAAIDAFLSAGVYTAAQAVAEPELLDDRSMNRFLAFCRSLGVHDVVLLNPAPVGVRGGCAPMGEDAKRGLARMHLRSARDRSSPKVTTMALMEGPEFLGCQAGFGMLYVSTGGDMSPCDFVPLSFGNVYEIGLEAVLERLAERFTAPCRDCLGVRLRGLAGEGGAYPVAWEHTNELVGRLDGGGPADLMKLMLPRGRRG